MIQTTNTHRAYLFDKQYMICTISLVKSAKRHLAIKAQEIVLLANSIDRKLTETECILGRFVLDMITTTIYINTIQQFTGRIFKCIYPFQVNRLKVLIPPSDTVEVNKRLIYPKHPPKLCFLVLTRLNLLHSIVVMHGRSLIHNTLPQIYSIKTGVFLLKAVACHAFRTEVCMKIPP